MNYVYIWKEPVEDYDTTPERFIVVAPDVGTARSLIDEAVKQTDNIVPRAAWEKTRGRLPKHIFPDIIGVYEI